MSIAGETPGGGPTDLPPGAAAPPEPTAGLLAAIGEADADFLARMAPWQRSRQVIARGEMAHYCALLAEDLRGRGADERAHEAAVALRELCAYLRGAAEEATDEADDWDEHIDWPHDSDFEDREAARVDAVETWIHTAGLADLEAAREACNPADLFVLDRAIAARREGHPPARP